ncbi:Retinoic acid receptor RXR-alpha [Galemys pyrenaicus]|uniref:Retinoic acid receptor RXR-alpha n=1 Tax=Galemys pyrenaicus TaxID=202257 RepID=A0A8J5ZSB1_GALPY|nr:Retinoic acid receptor RXR-alpha [Galemys pyrenaicus]
MAAPSLHPSLAPGIGASLGSPGQLHSPISTLSSPINGMGPPFSVISSPVGPHSMSVPPASALGFGTGSPQVSAAARGLVGRAAGVAPVLEPAPQLPLPGPGPAPWTPQAAPAPRPSSVRAAPRGGPGSAQARLVSAAGGLGPAPAGPGPSTV